MEGRRKRLFGRATLVQPEEFVFLLGAPVSLHPLHHICLFSFSFVTLTNQHTNTPTHQHTNTPTHQHTNTPTHQHTNTTHTTPTTSTTQPLHNQLVKTVRASSDFVGAQFKGLLLYAQVHRAMRTTTKTRRKQWRAANLLAMVCFVKKPCRRVFKSSGSFYRRYRQDLFSIPHSPS